MVFTVAALVRRAGEAGKTPLNVMRKQVDARAVKAYILEAGVVRKIGVQRPIAWRLGNQGMTAVFPRRTPAPAAKGYTHGLRSVRRFGARRMPYS